MLLRSDSLHSELRVGVTELQRQGYYWNEDSWGANRHVCVFFKRFYLFIFRERRKEGEREGEKHQCVVAS